MVTEKDITLFDDYLNGDLSDAREAEFESKLRKDAAFENKFNRYKKDCELIFNARELSGLRKQLSAIHSESFPKKRIFLLNPRILIPLGIAATLLIGVFIVSRNQLKKSSYNELSYATESSEENLDFVVVEEIPDEIVTYNGLSKSEHSSEEIVNGDFTDNNINFKKTRPFGTAFLIDLNGYLITSKHLINNRDTIHLQQRDNDISFKAAVIFSDSLLDFALLKAPKKYFENLGRIPYQLPLQETELGDEVFTIGFSKKDLVYTKGDVSSKSGYMSDENYIEVSMPSNPGNSGAPLFNNAGALVGIITANNSNKQNVTYSLNHTILGERLMNLKDIGFKLPKARAKYYKYRKNLIKKLKPFIFEVH